MDRKLLKDYVYELLVPYRKEYEATFRDIALIRSNPERIDRYGRRIQEMFREGFGVIRASDKNPMPYVFTGKCYEPCDFYVLYDALDRWLESAGVLAVDRTQKYMFMYMSRVMNVMRDHELHPDLSIMCFDNCVVNMNNLRTYPHSPKFDCVKLYPFKYDRREIRKCPIWKSFLGEPWMSAQPLDGVLPEKHKRRILQMFLGACLVNRKNISFEYFLILQGTGSNGKSVIYRVLKELFGEEEILNIKMSQFARGGDEQLRAAYSMEGKRLMYCTESSKGDFKDMSIIKAISSGEPIACRGIGGNITMMQRPPVMLCNSNYRWQPSDFLNREDPDDLSMQRRAIVLNFDKTIPTERRDTTLAERMRGEFPGIMAWIVKGLYELKKNKWRMPENYGGEIDLKLERLRSTTLGRNGKPVDGSITEYLRYKGCHNETDTAHPFSREVTSTELYKNYVRFCKRNGVAYAVQRKFGIDLLSLGYERTVNVNSMYTLWFEQEEQASKLLISVPSIAESVKATLFEGEEYTEEEFINDDLGGFGEDE